MAEIQRVVTTTQAYEGRRSPPRTPLRILRAVSGLSAAELARLADVDRATVGRLESGIGRPQRRTARKLAAVLGCPVELIFPQDDHRDAVAPDAEPIQVNGERS